MNVKIEEQNLKFKISEEELKILLEGHCLNTKVSFLDKTLTIVLNPQGSTPEMESKLSCDEGDVYLTLFIPPVKIQELSVIGKNREGVKSQTNDNCLSLQVDIRKDNRKAVKK